MVADIARLLGLAASRTEAHTVKNADIEWSLPLGNLQDKIKAIGLVYSVGTIIAVQPLSLGGRVVWWLAALPGLVLLLSMARSRSWISSKRLRIRNAWASDVYIDRDDVKNLEWRRIAGLGLGFVRVVSADGSRYAMSSTLGTNGSWRDIEAAIKSTIEHAV